jgi:hypothetical protein
VVLPHGRVIWENVEDDDGGPRHLEGLTRRATLKLMELAADGDLESVEAHSWAPGYGDGSTNLNPCPSRATRRSTPSP